jgi:hypothetical protein
VLLVVLAVLGAQQFLEARRRRRDMLRAQKHEALQAWEGEGGAVPVGSNRTAAAVTPTRADAM